MKHLILILLSLIAFTSCTENYSEGERIGTVVQFSKTGLIFESWEGQLNLTQTGMNTSGEPFDFSFDNDLDTQDELISLVSEAQAKGWKVKLKYHAVAGWNWFKNRGNTNHFITDVEVIDKNFANPLQKGILSTDTLQLGTKENPIHIVIDM